MKTFRLLLLVLAFNITYAQQPAADLEFNIQIDNFLQPESLLTPDKKVKFDFIPLGTSVCRNDMPSDCGYQVLNDPITTFILWADEPGSEDENSLICNEIGLQYRWCSEDLSMDILPATTCADMNNHVRGMRNNIYLVKRN